MSIVSDPLSTQPHPLVGTVLRGTYEVKRLLDRGGMGIVFEAEQVRLRRKVAIKILPGHLAQESQALLRFEREAELVSMLQNPYVVQIVDFDTTEDGEPYIVMEYLSGESLELRLAHQPALPLDLAVRIATQVAAGLAAVHGALIVHRDLKPANIFLTELPGDGFHVKLLDFGIGKRIGTPQGLTGENDVMGTPDYMPPEQALGKTAHVDQRGDQYSLAVIVYEMLAGRNPFEGDMMAILEQVIGSQAPPIESFVPTLPSGVGPVLRRAMAKEPSQRYESITDFASALASAAARPAPSSTPTPSSNTTLRLTSDPSVLNEGVRRERPTAGSRAPERSPISTMPEAPSIIRLTKALEGAKKARSARDVDLAAKLVERALSIGDALGNSESAAALNREEALIEGSLEVRLGRLEHALRV
ncbi:MAG TPA: serine/threonine-protein kinase, partial [Polyangiaceae bacterium]|nr:serine/threonine-protein kinase [Polyangiaceae bacterium]